MLFRILDRPIFVFVIITQIHYLAFAAHTTQSGLAELTNSMNRLSLKDNADSMSQSGSQGGSESKTDEQTDSSCLDEDDLEEMLSEAKTTPEYLYNYLQNLYELIRENRENDLTKKITPDLVATVLRKMKIDLEKPVINSKETVLLKCTKKWHESHNFIAEVLCRAGASVHVTDKKKNTPLHYAAKRGAEKIVALLINRKADVNAKNRNKETPFHLVAESGHSSIARKTNWEEIGDMLINAKANVRTTDIWGNTPLHNAATREWYDLCWYYRREHADLYKKRNIRRERPIDIWPRLGQAFWYPKI